MINGDMVLEKIKNGSIMAELVDRSELSLNEKDGEILDCVISFHKKEFPVLPKADDIARKLNLLHKSYVWKRSKQLKKDEVLCSVTFPQIFNNFKLDCKKPALPKSLYFATSQDLDNYKSNYQGNSFRKKMTKNPTASYWSKYYIALVTEKSVDGNKVPTFQLIFDFLSSYKTEMP